jgi:hypothetical protein
LSLKPCGNFAHEMAVLQFLVKETNQLNRKYLADETFLGTIPLACAGREPGWCEEKVLVRKMAARCVPKGARPGGRCNARCGQVNCSD